MPLKFRGTIEDLKKLVKSAGITGNWSVDSSGKRTFRSIEGGILNWWTNGTINFQGKDCAQLMLKRSLVKYLSTIPATNCDYVDAEYFESVEQHYQLNNAADSTGDTLSLLLRIVEILTTSGYVAKKINDSTYVVGDSSDQSYCILQQKYFDVLLPV